MKFNFRDFKLFETSNDITHTSLCDFIFAYFICLGAMWTILIVIDNTFWFLPIFWYFAANQIERSIKKYLDTVDGDTTVTPIYKYRQ